MEGDSLESYRAKMSQAVSQAIMASPAERQRRALQLGENNRQASAREKSSLTAKKTSSRPEILAQRSENLHRWRKNNPQKFQATIERMLSTRVSRPEKVLFELLADFKFDRQVLIRHQECPNFSKTLRVDIGCLKRKILIEFDGPFHFQPIQGHDHLEYRKKRDKVLEIYALENCTTLIRIARSQYAKGKFLEPCVSEVLKIIENPRPGIYYFGEEYSLEKDSDRPDADLGNDRD